MNEYFIFRLECLKLAQTYEISPDQTIELAQKFANFVEGIKEQTAIEVKD